MASYFQLLAITFPAFGLFGLGIAARRIGWLTHEAENSLLKLIMNLFYPCLVFRAVVGNDALQNPANLWQAPVIGAATLLLGMFLGYQVGKALGLHVGTGLRTFAFAVGIYNYGYIPIPLVDALWGRETLGVLLVYNVGIEAALWTVGILLLAGFSLREGWRKLLNPVALSLVAAVLLNAVGLKLPTMIGNAMSMLGGCTVPLGLLVAGAAVEEYLRRPSELFEPKTSVSATLLRLGIIPLCFVVLAKYAPLTVEMKRILVIQAAMPAGMFPIVIARHYGGQPLVAARIFLVTTLVAILLIPLWISQGLAWVSP